MGRVIKASALASRPDRLGMEAERAKAELISARIALAHIREEARDQVIDLALGIAEKVIGKAVSLEPALLDSIYEKALSRARETGPLTLYVNPGDLDTGRAGEIGRNHGVEIVGDRSVGRAGCRVKVGDIEVDATLETILGALRQAMKGG